MAKPWVIGAACFVVGALGASGAWTAFPPKAPKLDAPVARPEPKDESGLAAANANLTASLMECDRRLAELGERPVERPQAVASAAPADPGGRRRGRPGALTSEDWERMAESGVVPVRVPCLRDTPWSPSDRVVDRLGLAPGDADTIKEAYAASNKRLTDAIRPLCAQVLGGNDVADKVGASQCIDIINNSARKTDADGTKAALTRVAEAQAGKREAAKGGPAIEQLATLLTAESRTFEGDLAQKLGPEEAKRLANDPAMCADRKMLRAGDVELGGGGGGGGGRRGRR